jgi:hypothetical protein
MADDRVLLTKKLRWLAGMRANAARTDSLIKHHDRQHGGRHGEAKAGP